MTSQEINETDISATVKNALNGGGIKVRSIAPSLLRIFGKRFITMTVKQPSGGTLIRIAKYWNKTGADLNTVSSISDQAALLYFQRHGYDMSKALAAAILNSWLLGLFFTRPLAAFIRSHVKPEPIIKTLELVLLYGGIDDFLHMARLIRSTKLTAPNINK